MSTGGWEVVGKNKKDKGNAKNGKLTKTEKKKFIENAPKVEDFLPLSQVKTLYDTLNGNKENKKPSKGKENKTKENEEKRKQQHKQQQKQQQQTVEKKKQEPKEKPPKSIKDALNAIDPAELSDILASGQVRFPEAPLIWLKDLAAFLNVKIPIDKEDPTFTGKSIDYPLNLVPKCISSTLEKAVEIAGQQTTQHFYEVMLTTMVTEMAKGTPVVGYKIFLQLLSHLNPEIAVANISKAITLKNSYQNRKPIGLSLLWALSQSGQKNLVAGLKIWHEVMSSMLETKTYASYVSQILNDLVFGHENVQDLSPELYLSIIDDAYSGKYNISNAMISNLDTSVEKLRTILIKNKNINYSKLFELLMSKITTKVKPLYRDELVKTLAALLITDPLCFCTWRSIYPKHLYESQFLLAYIDSNLSKLRNSLKMKMLRESLQFFQTPNEKIKGKSLLVRQDLCSEECKKILGKMTASSRKGFPWNKGCFILLVLIGAIIAFDYRKNGSFEASSTGKFLKNSGISAYSQRVWTTSGTYLSKGLSAIEASSPEYYKAAVDFGTPYIKLGGDVYLTMRNLSVKLYHNTAVYIEKNGPVVIDTVNHYAPGMLDLIQLRTSQGFELVKVYSAFLTEKFVEYSVVSVRWLETNVFTGQLSPKNLQNYALKAIDSTQAFASQTYDWVYEKVQTLSKVP